MKVEEIKPVVFLHVPKTAGTTLHKILSQQYSPSGTLVTHESRPAEIEEDAKRIVRGEMPRYELVMGHLGLGIHEVIPQARYISCVREPVARLVSHFHYARDTPGHYLRDQILDADMNLVDYVSSGLSGELINGMTRAFAGVEDFHGAVVDEAVLETAKKNIDELFIFVGTTERFDAGLMVLQDIMGWKTPYYVRRKVGNYKGAKKKISKEETDEIARLNALDIELYRYVSDALDRQIAEAADNESQVASFKRANKTYGRGIFCCRDAFRRVGIKCPF